MKPLAGFKVIEIYAADSPLAVRLAGALAGRLLADFGAQVLFEPPPPGDALRQLPPLTGGASATLAFLSAGKQAVSIGPDAAAWADLLAGQDGAILDAALVDVAVDAAVEAGSHAALPRSALPRAAALLSMFPDGRADAPGSEFTVMALSGVLDIVGDPQREPLQLAGHQAAYSAGLAGFTGLLAALCLAATPGRPETVRVNLLDTLLWINWKSVIAALTPAGAPTRQGDAAEWQVIGCADGWMALVYQESDWAALRGLVGDPALHAPRFATAAGRRGHGRELAAIIQAGMAPLTRAEIRSLALARRLPLGPVWSIAELLHDRHYLERGFLFPADPPGGAGAMPSAPVVWNAARFAPGRVPAALGFPHA